MTHNGQITQPELFEQQPLVRSYSMHSVRRAAHRSAWSQEGSGAIPNPFARGGRPKKLVDVENRPIQHHNTVDEGNSPIAVARRDNNADSYASGGMQHASTFPEKPMRSLSRGETSDDITSDASKPSSDNAYTNVSEPPTQIVDTITDGNVASSNRTRKRKFFPFGGSKKKESEDEYKQRPNEAPEEAEDSGKTKDPNVTIISMIKVVLFSWVNILLIFVPVGIICNYVLDHSRTMRVLVFVLNFIAIVPLAGMLSFATEELALYVGETLGGLLNASFGNAVELIVSIIALKEGQITIVQTSLLGSMLSNLLLVLGMCFFFGGLRRQEQHFNVTVAQTAASLLALAIMSLIIPTAFAEFSDVDSGVTPASRGTAVMLLVVYGCYLLFQLKTHRLMYNEPSKKVDKTPSDPNSSTKKVLRKVGLKKENTEAEPQTENEIEQDDEPETPQLTRLGALVALAISTVLVALCAEFMVSSIDAISDSGVSKEFIGLILLPIVGNAAEHATAVTVAIKDKMDLSIGVAVGSSLQIALLVIPVMILLNWFGVGSPKALTLDFDPFQVVVLFISIILVNYLIQDGKSHWLEGVMLQMTYLIIALAAWFYPVPPNHD